MIEDAHKWMNTKGIPKFHMLISSRENITLEIHLLSDEPPKSPSIYYLLFLLGYICRLCFRTPSLLFEAHPIHLHGQNFYIVGTGFGTFNNVSDPANFNLVDPPSRNTVSIPNGGWAAVRFRIINPGVWFLHCHIDLHASWGMSVAFIVKNGVGSLETLQTPPPPADLPR